MNYMSITKNDTNNGDGFRVVLWVSGCTHHCRGCQNKFSWESGIGEKFTEQTKEELFKELNREEIEGITLSGGDPLFPSNIKEISLLCKEIKDKYPNKTIWMYTGSLFSEIRELEVTKYLDVVVDDEYIMEERDISLKWRGSSNQRVIDVQKSLKLKNEIELVLHCD